MGASLSGKDYVAALDFVERLHGVRDAFPQWLLREGLTQRELEILLVAEQGKTNEEIAAALFISPATDKKHLQNIFPKLRVSNRTAAVARLRASHSR